MEDKERKKLIKIIWEATKLVKGSQTRVQFYVYKRGFKFGTIYKNIFYPFYRYGIRTGKPIGHGSWRSAKKHEIVEVVRNILNDLDRHKPYPL